MATFAVELAQAEARFSELIRQVDGGAEVVITRSGRPIARLVPASESGADREPGSARGLFRVPDDFDAPLDDFREYM